MSRHRSVLIRAIVVPTLALAALATTLLKGGFPYARITTLIVLLVLVADVASLARGRLQNALVVVAALLFGLVALEAVAQTIEPQVVIKHPRALWTDRAALGWGPKTGGVFPVEKRVDGKTIYKVVYTIDDDLLRHTNAAADGPTIAFLGDSFTFGEGLNDPDTIAQSFADAAPGFHVMNLAFSAYSPSQALRELEVGLFDKELGTPRAFVLETGPWHSERTSCKPNFSIRAPRYVTVDGQLRYEGPCTTGLVRRVEEFYKEMAAYQLFLAPLLQRPTHGDIENYLNIVVAVAKIVREKYQSALTVLYVTPEPHYLDGTGFTDADIRARLSAEAIHLVDATLDAKPGQSLTIPGDGHPTGTANRLLAARLIEAMHRATPDVLKVQDRP